MSIVGLLLRLRRYHRRWGWRLASKASQDRQWHQCKAGELPENLPCPSICLDILILRCLIDVHPADSILDVVLAPPQRLDLHLSCNDVSHGHLDVAIGKVGELPGDRRYVLVEPVHHLVEYLFHGIIPGLTRTFTARIALIHRVLA